MLFIIINVNLKKYINIINCLLKCLNVLFTIHIQCKAILLFHFEYKFKNNHLFFKCEVIKKNKKYILSPVKSKDVCKEKNYIL